MGKYKWIIECPDGTIMDSLVDDDEVFDSESDAEEAALYAISCMRLGGEILHMSNPGDYSYDEDDYNDIEYDIIDLEDEE